MDSPIPEKVVRIIISRICENLQDQENKSHFVCSNYNLSYIIGEVTTRVLKEYKELIVKNSIIRACQNLYQMGYFAGTSGNISVRMENGEFFITASGINKGNITPDGIIKSNKKGEKISGFGEPSSEIKMHLYSYEKRRDINAIVHAHPPFATGFATAGIPLDKPVLPEAILVLGSIPLVKYGTPSTWEIPQMLEPYLADHNVFLLANHGTLAFGKDLAQAVHRTETLELFAKVILIARMLGGEKLLTKEHLEKLSKTL